jgi:hypothetical protein
VKKYPDYEVTATSMRANACTVTVSAFTDCGPVISAHSTVRASANDLAVALRDHAEMVRRLEAAAAEIAARNLRHEYDVVVVSCVRRGNHKGHKP